MHCMGTMVTYIGRIIAPHCEFKMTHRARSFIRILEEREVLIFERIKKFLIDCKSLVPFTPRKPFSFRLLSTHDLAVIVQFLACNENLIIGPSSFRPLTRNEQSIITSSICRKSAESPFYTSYIMEQSFIDRLKIPSEHYWIYKPYRSLNVDQRIVDLLVLGREKTSVDMVWDNLVEEYETKKTEMLQKVEGLRDVFKDLLNRDLVLGGAVRGSAGSSKRYPTENDVDIVILTPSHENHSRIKSILTEKASGFKTLNWSEDESETLDPDEKYELDVDLIAATWLPLHSIMAKAHCDIINDATILFGQEAIERYKSKLEEIMLSARANSLPASEN